jgi:Protein of unknown function (DUF3300)
MTTHLLFSTHSSNLSLSRRVLGILICAGFLFVTNAVAEAPTSESGGTSSISNNPTENLVGPIALYPDDLVAIILPAATNPLQIVQADRYLEKRKANASLPIDDNWDNAVKSLLNYPEVVKKMSTDLDWTTALGEAVVADQSAVLEAIQVFRRKAQSVDSLKSDSKQTVIVEKEVIKIVPADPQVIYVPQYNPTTVVVYGGYSSWGYYPAPYPVYYYPYPPGAALATGLIWGAAISSAWNGGHYHADYHGGGGNNNINIDRNTNININGGNKPGQLPAGSSSQWKPNSQPGRVGKVNSTSSRVGYNNSGAGAGLGNSIAQHSSTQQTNGVRGGNTAFDRYSSGRQTQMDSSRGISSRSSMSSAGSSQMTRGNSGGVSRGGFARGSRGGRR